MGNSACCSSRPKDESDPFLLSPVERQQLAQGFGGGRQAAPNPSSGSDFAQQVGEVIPGTVLLLSGCKDEQTSADVGNVASFGLPMDAGPGGAGGACTNSLIKAIDESGDHSWISLLERMRTILKQKKYTQIPQLSSSHEKDMKDKFSACNKSPNDRYKALLIGINYAGSSSALKGCHNDVETMRRFLGTQGYAEDCMRIMLDDDKSEQPTRANVLNAMSWLVEGATSGDSLFLHYSGHGTQTKDKTGTEKDGLCEAICPVDFNKEGLILDKEIFLTLVAPLSKGVQLVAVMDCCHSCGVMDLPYTFKSTAEGLKEARKDSKMKKNNKFNLSTAVNLVNQLAKVLGKSNNQAAAGGRGTGVGNSKSQISASTPGNRSDARVGLDGRNAGALVGHGQQFDARGNSAALASRTRPVTLPSGPVLQTGQARFSAPVQATGGIGSGSGLGASGPSFPSPPAQNTQTRFSAQSFALGGGSGSHRTSGPTSTVISGGGGAGGHRTSGHTSMASSGHGGGGAGGHRTSGPASKPSSGHGGGASRSTGRRR